MIINESKKIKTTTMGSLPLTIESDNEYLSVLSDFLSDYLTWVKTLFLNKYQYVYILDKETKKQIFAKINRDVSIIKDCVQLYYRGNVSKASYRVLELLKRIIDEDKNKFIVSEIDKSYSTRLMACFPDFCDDSYNYQNLRDTELNFYRARTEYFTSPREMYHIPFDKRDLVGTERFSIPGVPCLYMGTSVYDVWLELGRPPYSKFNVSSIKLKEEGKKLNVLNLAITKGMIEGVNSNIGNKVTKEKTTLITTMLRIYPIIIASSIRNTNSKGKFKSEYIISHLIMMNLQKLKIDGVAYISKRLKNNEEYCAYPQMVNLAFPAFEQSLKNNKYGSICEKILVTKPQNYEEFISLKLYEGELGNNSFFSRCFRGDDNSNIHINGRLRDYFRTKFQEFENSICGLDFYDFEEVLKIT